MPFMGAVLLLKVRQSPWACTLTMRNSANRRAYRHFNLPGQPAVGAQVVAAYYDILSRPS
jgi:hypothetical protein